MTCKWPSREPCVRNLEPGAQESQTQGNVQRSLLPPFFRTKPGQYDARSCGEKENPRVTRVVIQRNSNGQYINVSQKLPEERSKQKW